MLTLACLFGLVAVMGYSFGQIAIAIIVFMALAAIIMIATKVFGIPIPQWVWQVIGVVIAAVVLIVAVQFIMGL